MTKHAEPETESVTECAGPVLGSGSVSVTLSLSRYILTHNAHPPTRGLICSTGSRRPIHGRTAKLPIPELDVIPVSYPAFALLGLAVDVELSSSSSVPTPQPGISRPVQIIM